MYKREIGIIILIRVIVVFESAKIKNNIMPKQIKNSVTRFIMD